MARPMKRAKVSEPKAAKLRAAPRTTTKKSIISPKSPPLADKENQMVNGVSKISRECSRRRRGDLKQLVPS